MYRRQQPQVVPLHVAQEIVEQRDALVEEVRRLREAAQRHEADLRSLEAQTNLLKDQLAETERDLRASQACVDELQHTEESDEDARVAELESDLARVSSQLKESKRASTTEERRRLVSQLGSVWDSVEMALRLNQEPGPWREGIESIQAQLRSFLVANGAELIGAVGETFDPTIHEALATVDDMGLEPGTIAQVHRRGILVDGKLARTAQVLVAK